MPIPSLRELRRFTLDYALSSREVRDVDFSYTSVAVTAEGVDNALSSNEVRDVDFPYTSVAVPAEGVDHALTSKKVSDIDFSRTSAVFLAESVDYAYSSTDEKDVDINNTLTFASRGCGIRGRPEALLPPAPNPSTSCSISKGIGDSELLIHDTIDDNVEYVMSVLSELNEDSIEKFDSGASRCMSGDPSRLVTIKPNIMNRVKIVGFNNTSSEPTSCGFNVDNIEEYYVSDMPTNLTLLCANAYCQDGCAVLFANDGLVLRMTKSELANLKEFLTNYPVIKTLKVRNRTNEVDQDNNPTIGVETSHTVYEDALQGTASRFFNTKVNVSNQTERILTLLMTGLSFRDWQTHVKHGSLGGMPPDLTLHGLNRFEYRYGRTPDIVRLAHPLNVRDATGLREDRAEPTRTGDRIEIDCMYSDYNIRETAPPTPENKVIAMKTRKLPSHGGAIAGALCVDCFSSFVHGQLLKSVAHPETFVEGFLCRLKLDDVIVRTLAADGGVVTNSQFQVLTTKVETLCTKWNIRSIERSEPYAHARITGSVEREIGLVKSLIRLAITLILRNPNFPILGFTPIMIFKLWGEFFLWAINMINLKPCPRQPNKSSY